MYSREFTDHLDNIMISSRLYKNEMMSRHTTFKAGGKADFLAMPTSPDEINRVISLCREEKVPYYVMGNGSNVLVKDDGYRGVIIKIAENMKGCEVNDGRQCITAQAGISLALLASRAYKYGLSGMEFASGIPGTLGGAVAMNAGAYGGEMKDIIKSVEVMNNKGEILTLENGALGFGYRTSAIQLNDLYVLKATLQLEKGDYNDIHDLMTEYNNRRKEKQPLQYPSAGSTFKRPDGYYAGKLIMDANLRGYSIGGAQVSEKHCGFIINKNDANANDIIALIEDVQRIVHETFGVTLQREVKIIG
jgi:UDP-N-acetylmuramate dehydrogenase